MITGSEQGVIRFGRGGETGRVWRGRGLAVRTPLMARLVFFEARTFLFFKGEAIRGGLVLLCLDHCGDLVKLSPIGQSMLDRGDCCSANAQNTHTHRGVMTALQTRKLL